MKRLLILAGFTLLLLPASGMAGDLHRTLSEAHAELLATAERPAALRGTASTQLIEKLEVLARATRSEAMLGEKSQRVLDFARFQLEQGGRIAPLDLPRAIPTHRQPGGAGERCETALPLRSGEAMELQMLPGESIWFRVQGTPESGLGLSTRGSRLDTRLSAWPDCRELVTDPIATADDSIGLLAELTLAPGGQSFWLVRLDNLDSKAGTAVMSGVDFSLVQGRVRRATDLAPAANYQVGMFRIIDGTYLFSGSVFTDSDGRYLIGYQDNGSYAFRTAAWSHPMNLGDQAWEGVPCWDRTVFTMFDCTQGPQQPTPVLLTGGSRTLDFALQPLGDVRGIVVDAESGLPLADAWLELLSLDGEWRRSAQTDAAGRYTMLLPATSPHYVTAQATGYRRQLFAGIDCPSSSGCPLPSGTPIQSGPSGATVRADFALSRRPTLRFEVSIDGEPAAADDFMQVTLFNEAGQPWSGFSFIGPVGEASDLRTGTQRVRMQTAVASRQLYDGVNCSSFCIEELQLATPVVIPDSGSSIQLLQFDLKRLPVLRGRVTDTQDGSPIYPATVSLFDEIGFRRADATTDVEGNYIFNGVPLGRYLVSAQATTHARELFDGIPCPVTTGVLGCPGAAVIEFATDSPDVEIDFALLSNPRISGHIETLSPSSPFDLPFYLVGDVGQVLAQTWVVLAPDGSYETRDFPPGAGRLAVGGVSQIAQIFPFRDCAGANFSSFVACDLGGTTVLDLESGTHYPDIDFRLRRRFSWTVQVLNALDNAPLANVSLDLWRASGERFDTEITRSDGRAFFGNSTPEPVFLSTFNLHGLQEQVYDGIPCPQGSVYFGLCSLQGATPLSFDENGASAEIVIRLSNGTTLFTHGFEP
ncbi:MAG: carboxypeptidase-like regulatory domain-containing protein [Aquimonas sp.]|nr:carboxypeptidase-like regulatory domain-containing protein [Aquimonas sp.]